MPCGGDESQICGGDWKMNVYERMDSKNPVYSCLGIATVEVGCVLGSCTEYNFTATRISGLVGSSAIVRLSILVK